MPGFRVFSYYYARITMLLAITSLIPGFVSMVLGEDILFIALCFISSLLLFSISWITDRYGTPGEIGLVDASALTALSFLTAGIAASIPIMIYDEPLNALFEGVSAITTTGLSSLHSYALTPGVHFLRSFYQWIGGLSIALLTITILVQPGSSAYNIYIVHMGKMKPKPLSSSAIKLILKIYIVLTVFFILLYMFIGQDPFTSVINALTTVSTGGFSTMNYFGGLNLYIALILMFVSAQPILIYYYVFKNRRLLHRLDVQMISFITITIIAGILLYISSNISIGEAFFQTVSALSTTGYTSINNNILGDHAKLLLSVLMIIGAGLGSTGGGLKQLRLIILFKSIGNALRKPLLPRKTITMVKVRGVNVSSDEVEWTYMLLTLYIMVLIVSTWIFTLYGYSLVDSLFESSSALATTGLSIGLSGPGLENPLKIVLIIDMLLGRVEIIPYIYLVTYVWRIRR